MNVDRLAVQRPRGLVLAALEGVQPEVPLAAIGRGDDDALGSGNELALLVLVRDVLAFGLGLHFPEVGPLVVRAREAVPAAGLDDVLGDDSEDLVELVGAAPLVERGLALLGDDLDVVAALEGGGGEGDLVGGGEGCGCGGDGGGGHGCVPSLLWLVSCVSELVVVVARPSGRVPAGAVITALGKGLGAGDASDLVSRELEFLDDRGAVDQGIGKPVDAAPDFQVHGADDHEPVFDGDLAAGEGDLGFVVEESLDGAETLESQEVDFIENHRAAFLHGRDEHRVLEDRFAGLIVEVELPVEVVRQHARVAGHDFRFREHLDRLGGLASSGVAVEDDQALVDHRAHGDVGRGARELLKLGGLRLVRDGGGVGMVRQAEVAHDEVGHVLPFLAAEDRVEQAGLRPNPELAEEVEPLFGELGDHVAVGLGRSGGSGLDGWRGGSGLDRGSGSLGLDGSGGRSSGRDWR